MTFTRLSRNGFAAVFLLGVSFALLDSLSVDIADGPEDKDGDARTRKVTTSPRFRAEAAAASSVAAGNARYGEGGSRPSVQKKPMVKVSRKAKILLISALLGISESEANHPALALFPCPIFRCPYEIDDSLQK